ncbi:hypothetical protein AAHA92_20193 [Salvia divinorum]|uniref:Uncharacterized protein n=1 Tax=Salvia divinorum TaxID=28513 RepID=A0ABD1GHH1_SALDI
MRREQEQGTPTTGKSLNHFSASWPGYLPFISRSYPLKVCVVNFVYFASGLHVSAGNHLRDDCSTIFSTVRLALFYRQHVSEIHVILITG